MILVIVYVWACAVWLALMIWAGHPPKANVRTGTPDRTYQRSITSKQEADRIWREMKTAENRRRGLAFMRERTTEEMYELLVQAVKNTEEREVFERSVKEKQDSLTPCPTHDNCINISSTNQSGGITAGEVLVPPQLDPSVILQREKRKRKLDAINSVPMFEGLQGTMAIHPDVDEEWKQKLNSTPRLVSFEGLQGTKTWEFWHQAQLTISGPTPPKGYRLLKLLLPRWLFHRWLDWAMFK